MRRSWSLMLGVSIALGCGEFRSETSDGSEGGDGSGSDDGSSAGDGDGDTGTETGAGTATETATTSSNGEGTGDGSGEDASDSGDEGGGIGDDEACNDLTDPGWNGKASIGAAVPWLETIDQYDQDIRLCRYAGKPILIDFSTGWCFPCKEYAELLAGISQPTSNPIDQAVVRLKNAVASGNVYWVTVLTEDENGDQPDHAVLEAWHNAYPNEHVPVIADNDHQLYNHAVTDLAYPSFALISADFTWEALDTGSDNLVDNPLYIAAERYGE